MLLHNYLNYIDPGTGSMLFAIIIGVVTAGIFVVRGLFIKLKFFLQGGRGKQADLKKSTCVIFSDSKTYWNIFKPVCDEFERRGIECEYLTASNDDPALKEKYEHVKCEFVGEGNMAFAKLNMMRAVICLSTTPGLDVLQWKRSKDVECYIHIFHGIYDATVYRMFGLDHYDAVLMTGEFQREQIRAMEQMRNYPEKELKVAGVTNLDSLMSRLNKEGRKHNEKRTVLLAPSWGEASILNKYGAEFIQKLIGTRYKIIIRPHPQTKTVDPEMLKSLMEQFPDNENLSWNFDIDNFDCLNESDILISDYSGVVFDYAFVFDGPIMYADTTFQYEVYDAAWFEGPTWLLSTLPKIGRQLKQEDFDRMKDIIDEVIDSKEYKAGRDAARDEAWQERGKAAGNIVDFVVKKHDEIIEAQLKKEQETGRKKSGLLKKTKSN